MQLEKHFADKWYVFHHWKILFEYQLYQISNTENLYIRPSFNPKPLFMASCFDVYFILPHNIFIFYCIITMKNSLT